MFNFVRLRSEKFSMHNILQPIKSIILIFENLFLNKLLQSTSNFLAWVNLNLNIKRFFIPIKKHFLIIWASTPQIRLNIYWDTKEHGFFCSTHLCVFNIGSNRLSEHLNSRKYDSGKFTYLKVNSVWYAPRSLPKAWT